MDQNHNFQRHQRIAEKTRQKPGRSQLFAPPDQGGGKQEPVRVMMIDPYRDAAAGRGKAEPVGAIHRQEWRDMEDFPRFQPILGADGAVIVMETDPEKRAPGYESWWDVPIAQVSETNSVQSARKEFERAVKNERYFL